MSYADIRYPRAKIVSMQVGPTQSRNIPKKEVLLPKKRDFFF